ncbi:hypothetical protein N7471_013491 [Penicillium samsonianum]|uniref:uncharacterized protein n=1 Tax=Penicillium samsonianum TaxID=1882272 RepID=UPI0025481296|nr:uncharacterized protein N7471_013491 [Penicillium samsonianum]KAJ6118871.1 hypothetical protein N7471_013491 [Penicillium samsonianum]
MPVAPEWPPAISFILLATPLKSADSVNPIVVEAMREEGVDFSNQKPKILTADAVQDSDVVITMGCGDAYPFFAGKRYLDWQLNDPARQGLDAVRTIRHEIRQHIERLITKLQCYA